MKLLVLIYQCKYLSGSDDKETACNAGDLGSVPGSGRSLREGNGYPLHNTHFSIVPGEFHGQRSLAGYSPWGLEAVGHN